MAPITTIPPRTPKVIHNQVKPFSGVSCVPSFVTPLSIMNVSMLSKAIIIEFGVTEKDIFLIASPFLTKQLTLLES